MNTSEELIIYLDIFVFISLIVFFIILFKSSGLFRKKNQKKLINKVGK